jgi:hypothetical protein
VVVRIKKSKPPLGIKPWSSSLYLVCVVIEEPVKMGELQEDFRLSSEAVGSCVTCTSEIKLHSIFFSGSGHIHFP